MVPRHISRTEDTKGQWELTIDPILNLEKMGRAAHVLCAHRQLEKPQAAPPTMRHSLGYAFDNHSSCLVSGFI